MERFKAILLRDCGSCEPGTIVEVAAGAREYAGRWLVLLPVEIASSYLVPLIDADRAITTKEAAHIFSCRRGHLVRVNKVRRYVGLGYLEPAGQIPGAKGHASWMFSREVVWKMPWPKYGAKSGDQHWTRRRKRQQEAANEAQEAS